MWIWILGLPPLLHYITLLTINKIATTQVSFFVCFFLEMKTNSRLKQQVQMTLLQHYHDSFWLKSWAKSYKACEGVTHLGISPCTHLQRTWPWHRCRRQLPAALPAACRTHTPTVEWGKNPCTWWNSKWEYTIKTVLRTCNYRYTGRIIFFCFFNQWIH